MKRLSDNDLEEIAEIAVSAAQGFIFSRVSKKEIIDLDVTAEIDYNEKLNIDVVVDILFDDPTKADRKIADDAADYAIEKVEKFLDQSYRINPD